MPSYLNSNQRKQYEESLKNTGQIGDQPVQNNVQPPKPDPKAEAWAERNEWFGKDEPMTLTSFSIHRKLVEKGIDPSTDEYYTEIDRRIRGEFPHKFSEGQEVKSKPQQKVASASRADGKTPDQLGHGGTWSALSLVSRP